MVVAVMVAGVFAFTANTADAQVACTVVSTLRQGSVGTEVMCLQTKLGITADGKFGPMTAAAVRAFQTANGLSADGIVGPMTRSVLGGGAVVTPGLPAGCTSTAGYSPVTGQPCSGGSGVNLPAGCTSTVGYSPTTGVKCDGTSTPPVTTTGEGVVTLSYAPVPANSTSVDKGQSKNVMALEVKATGSDMNVNRIWLNIGTRAWLSASEVAIMDGSTVIATLPLSASTVSEVTAGSVWRLEFNGLNINVPVNTTKTLTFKVTRPELTSANDNIVIATSSTLRATDGAGFSETYTLGGRTWVMSSNTAAVGTLTNTLSASNPKAQSNSGLSTTAGSLTAVELLRFDLKAKDGAVNVTRVQGTVAVASGTCALAECLASVELRDGSTVLSSKSAASPFDFNELDIDIAEGATKTLSVWGQANHVAASFVVKGDAIVAAVTAVTGTSGPSFTAANAANTVTGNNQYLFEYAPTITLGAASATNSGVDNRDGSFSLAFNITAPAGSDIYVSNTAVSTNAASRFFAEKTAAMGGTLAVSLSATNATAVGGDLAYRISAGQTATFTVTGLVPGATGTAGFTGMKLTEFDWNTTNATAGDVDQTWGLTDFKTPAVFVTGA